MGDFKFVPNQQGFVELRNEGFIQSECLAVAQKVASTASGLSGHAFASDVRPGRTRCHARAKCRVGADAQGGRKAWYKGAYRDAAKAAGAAAKSMGGKATWKGSKTTKGKK